VSCQLKGRQRVLLQRTKINKTMYLRLKIEKAKSVLGISYLGKYSGSEHGSFKSIYRQVVYSLFFVFFLSHKVVLVHCENYLQTYIDSTLHSTLHNSR
jgi:hypothetical protein